jgi:hypothetical protein
MYARGLPSPSGRSIGRSELSKVTFDLDRSIRDQCMLKMVGPTRVLSIISATMFVALTWAAAGLVRAKYSSNVAGSVGLLRSA